jgi:hypothetical protein
MKVGKAMVGFGGDRPSVRAKTPSRKASSVGEVEEAQETASGNRRQASEVEPRWVIGILPK